ncbi:hypothetical protein HMPREF0649_01757 [Segatella buccae D17]|nr:hypothetical protein HMPREF0649_01757 [Segatella buccae D17]
MTGGRPTLCEIPTILQPHRIPISKYWQNAKIFVALHLRNSTRSLIINSRPLIAILIHQKRECLFGTPSFLRRIWMAVKRKE